MFVVDINSVSFMVFVMYWWISVCCVVIEIHIYLDAKKRMPRSTTMSSCKKELPLWCAGKIWPCSLGAWCRTVLWSYG